MLFEGYHGLAVVGVILTVDLVVDVVRALVRNLKKVEVSSF